MTIIRANTVRCFVFATLVAGAGAAAADVFKCAGEGGTPVYQESPCPPGRELRNFQVDPPGITVLPAPVFTAPPPARPGTSPNGQGAGVKDHPPAKAARADSVSAERRHIRSGMSEGEVLARLGKPDATSGAKDRKSARWTYLPAPGDPQTVTSVTFANGMVTHVERKIVRK
jgi:hypothetical protein